MTSSSTAEGRAPSLLLACAALAGLFEGIAVAVDQVVQRDWSRLIVGYAWIALFVAVHLGIWSLLGRWAARRFGPVGVVRSVLLLWAMAVVVGRSVLGDRLPHGVWLPALAGLSLPLLLPARFWSIGAGRLGRAVAYLGVLLIGTTSLLGLVPDGSYPAPRVALALASWALAALLLLVLALRWRRSLVVALALLAIAGAGRRWMVAEPSGPNVLFVLLDTTRWDHVPPFGELVRDRSISWLAEQGVRFDEAVTVVPKTPGSVASNLTGLYPHRHGVRGLYDRLSEAQPTLGKLFGRQGYRTVGLVDNGWLTRGRGFGQGFERFRGYYEIASPYGPLTHLSWWRFVDQLSVRRVPGFSAQVSARRLTDAAIRELDRLRSDRFFMYVHYFEPHWPYFPPNEKALLYGGPPDGRTIVNFVPQVGLSRGRMIFANPLPEEENEKARRLYRGEVDDTLGEVRRLIEHLDGLGLGRDTIVVFTADHGHALGEHDYYFHHGEFLYDDSVRVPLVLRWPGGIPSGRVVRTQVRSIDVAPTLIRLAGVRGPADLDGRSLERVWESESAVDLPVLIESDEKMFAENTRRDVGGTLGKLRAVRTSTRKLILTPHRGAFEYELFDLENDPREVRNLSSDPAYREDFAALSRQLWAMLPPTEREALIALVRSGSAGPGEAAGSETDLEMLRSLGYIN